jgi:hypothetical protein
MVLSFSCLDSVSEAGNRLSASPGVQPRSTGGPRRRIGAGWLAWTGTVAGETLEPTVAVGVYQAGPDALRTTMAATTLTARLEMARAIRTTTRPDPTPAKRATSPHPNRLWSVDDDASPRMAAVHTDRRGTVSSPRTDRVTDPVEGPDRFTGVTTTEGTEIADE